VIDVRRQGDVSVVRMDAGENRFQPGLLDALDTALDDIAAADGPAALVLTGTGKYFSNGFDLERLDMVPRLQNLLARILELEAFTVAAINGHAFGAGAMLAIACDQRVMRADRGFWCLPEVDLGLPFAQGMQAMLVDRLGRPAAYEAMVTAARYGGPDAERRGIVDAARPDDELLPEAVRRAAAMAPKPRRALGVVKRQLNAAAVAALRA
jgi:enoyl-CoA hydratase/carnithine racemase